MDMSRSLFFAVGGRGCHSITKLINVVSIFKLLNYHSTVL